jgi:acetyltransferase-like isoleucine patch superfamily enzyme
MIKIFINKIIYGFKIVKFKRKWRKANSHNYTSVGNHFPIGKVSVGIRTYGKLNVKTYGNENEFLKIGSYCSIAGNVKFLLGGEHSYKSISTYPFEKYFCHKKENTITKGPIIIHDDVWIGENSIILSGVRIGQGAVIGAGSIVAKDIPPYGIYVNGKVSKYRFSEVIIDKLIKIDFSKLNEKQIIKNIDNLYETINEQNIDGILDVILSKPEDEIDEL